MTTLQVFIILTAHLFVTGAFFYGAFHRPRQDDMQTPLHRLDAKIDGVRSDLNRLAERIARIEGRMVRRPR